jgi:hypothetical protein
MKHDVAWQFLSAESGVPDNVKTACATRNVEKKPVRVDTPLTHAVEPK